MTEEGTIAAWAALAAALLALVVALAQAAQQYAATAHDMKKCERQVSHVCPSAVRVGLMAGDADRLPADIPVVPMQVSLRDIIALGLMIGMNIQEASEDYIEMSGPFGFIKSSSHPILGRLIHFSAFSTTPNIKGLKTGDISKSWLRRLIGVASVAKQQFDETKRRSHAAAMMRWRTNATRMPLKIEDSDTKGKGKEVGELQLKFVDLEGKEHAVPADKCSTWQDLVQFLESNGIATAPYIILGPENKAVAPKSWKPLLKVVRKGDLKPIFKIAEGDYEYLTLPLETLSAFQPASQEPSIKETTDEQIPLDTGNVIKYATRTLESPASLIKASLRESTDSIPRADSPVLDRDISLYPFPQDDTMRNTVERDGYFPSRGSSSPTNQTVPMQTKDSCNGKEQSVPTWVEDGLKTIVTMTLEAPAPVSLTGPVAKIGPTTPEAEASVANTGSAKTGSVKTGYAKTGCVKVGTVTLEATVLLSPIGPTAKRGTVTLDPTVLLSFTGTLAKIGTFTLEATVLLSPVGPAAKIGLQKFQNLQTFQTLQNLRKNSSDWDHRWRSKQTRAYDISGNFDTDPPQLTFYWASQIDIELGCWATPWERGIYNSCINALGMMVDTGLAGLSETARLAQPKANQTAVDSKEILYAEFPGPIILEDLWLHLREGEHTWPPYAINARGGVRGLATHSLVQHPVFRDDERLPQLTLLNSVRKARMMSTAETSTASQVLERDRVLELASIDFWLSHAAATNSISKGKSDLIINTPAIVEEIWLEFCDEIMRIQEKGWNPSGGDMHVRKLANSISDFISDFLGSPAEIYFVWVAFLRAVKVMECVANGPRTYPALDIFKNDILVYLV
ncbi:hypothetical protein Trihar35433_5058 [Trichoderma harzianum]|nr:hypothetical protein Trihar35433_5058 [Trichoderma harzianum]